MLAADNGGHNIGMHGLRRTHLCISYLTYPMLLYTVCNYRYSPAVYTRPPLTGLTDRNHAVRSSIWRKSNMHARQWCGGARSRLDRTHTNEGLQEPSAFVKDFRLDLVWQAQTRYQRWPVDCPTAHVSAITHIGSESLWSCCGSWERTLLTNSLMVECYACAKVRSGSMVTGLYIWWREILANMKMTVQTGDRLLKCRCLLSEMGSTLRVTTVTMNAAPFEPTVYRRSWGYIYSCSTNGLTSQLTYALIALALQTLCPCLSHC